MDSKKKTLNPQSSSPGPSKGPPKEKTQVKKNIGQSNVSGSLLQQMATMTATMQKHSEAIDALQTLPEALAELKGFISSAFDESNRQEYVEETNQSIHNDVDSAEQNILHLLGKAVETNISTESETPQELMDILNLNQPEPDYGPEIQKDIAESFGRMSVQKISKEKMDQWKEQNRAPNNCKTLGVPRVNPEIWAALPSKSRQTDFQQQQLQQIISLVSVGLAKMAEKLFINIKSLPGQLGPDLLRMIMEIGTMNGVISHELNSKRKTEIKPFLHKDIQSICTSQAPVTEYLFGDNLCEQLKASKAASNLLKAPTERNVRGNRFSPYNRGRTGSLNSFRASPYQRGHQQRPNQRFISNRGFRRGSFPNNQPIQH